MQFLITIISATLLNHFLNFQDTYTKGKLHYTFRDSPQATKLDKTCLDCSETECRGEVRRSKR